jgi:hypothetical protein
MIGTSKEGIQRRMCKLHWRSDFVSSTQIWSLWLISRSGRKTKRQTVLIRLAADGLA